ncbi:MAG TPA: glycosyltransferase family 87 protein [Tepidisphaeraceae bacterium]|nr:glycosyltransferase family 87 protein [Tepidisphaeraceae bacterium]
MGAVALPLMEKPAHPLRKKLWLAAGAITVFVLTIAIGNSVIDRRNAITADAVGHDFLAFYTAGHFLREAKAQRMYDLEAVRQFQQEVGQSNHLELKKQSFGPFWNPPFYAWLFVPLAGLPLRTALVMWWGLNLFCLAGAMILLCRMVSESTDWRIIGLVPAILLNSLPFHQALNHGQNTFTSLLILALTVWFWRKAAETRGAWNALWAGMICGLLFYKPQLGAAVAIVLVLHLGWRALAGVVITSIVLLGVTVISMPGIVEVYLAKMPGNLVWMQETNSYLWERHVTFKALWRLLFQGHDIGATSIAVKTLWMLSVVGLGAALASAIYQNIKWMRHHREGSPFATGRLISATIVAMPLLMPFYFDYDLLLLSVAAVLFAAELVARQREMQDEDRWLVRAWVVLFVVMFFNASVSGMIRVHLAVIALSVVAVMHIRRAWRIDRVVVS